MPDSTFGPLVTGADVEHAARDTLKLWTPEYLAWAERVKGLPPRTLVPPRTWIVSSSLERWAEDQLPCVLLLSTGLAEEPARDGRGMHRAKFALGLAAVVAARKEEEAAELAKLYVAVLRTLLLQYASLGGFATAVEWVDERYDALPGDRSRRRQLAAGQAVFRVEVPDVVTAGGGPLRSDPRPDPYEPYPDPPTVQTTSVEVQPEAINE